MPAGANFLKLRSRIRPRRTRVTSRAVAGPPPRGGATDTGRQAPASRGLVVGRRTRGGDLRRQPPRRPSSSTSASTRTSQRRRDGAATSCWMPAASETRGAASSSSTRATTRRSSGAWSTAPSFPRGRASPAASWRRQRQRGQNVLQGAGVRASPHGEGARRPGRHHGRKAGRRAACTCRETRPSRSASSSRKRSIAACISSRAACAGRSGDMGTAEARRGLRV